MNGKLKIATATLAVGVGAIGFAFVGGRDATPQPPPYRGPKPVQINAPGGPLHYLEQGDCLPLERHAACKQRLTPKER